MISKTKRLDYLDLLKGLTVLLVVLHHAGQPYGNGGSWPVIEALKIPWLDSFLAVNAAFFMGLLFFISGYIMPRSMEKDGPGLFLKKKMIRLGIPVLFIIIFFFGPINWFMGPSFSSFRAYLVWTITSGLHDMTGHLWFIIHLLIYSVLFASVVALMRKIGIPAKVADDHKTLKTGLLIAVGFLVGAIIVILVFLVRAVIPVRQWVNLLGFIPSEPAHLPQYAVLFLTGVIAGYYRIIERVPSWSGYLFLGIGIAAALYRYLQPAFSTADYPIYFLDGESEC